MLSGQGSAPVAHPVRPVIDNSRSVGFTGFSTSVCGRSANAHPLIAPFRKTLDQRMSETERTSRTASRIFDPLRSSSDHFVSGRRSVLDMLIYCPFRPIRGNEVPNTASGGRTLQGGRSAKTVTYLRRTGDQYFTKRSCTTTPVKEVALSK